MMNKLDMHFSFFSILSFEQLPDTLHNPDCFDDYYFYGNILHSQEIKPCTTVGRQPGGSDISTKQFQVVEQLFQSLSEMGGKTI